MMLPARDLRARQPVSCINAVPPPIDTLNANLGVPIAPTSINARANRFIGSRRYCSPIDNTRSASSAASRINLQAAMVKPIGFSVKTCTPESNAESANV